MIFLILTNSVIFTHIGLFKARKYVTTFTNVNYYIIHFRLAGRQTCSQFLKNERTGLLNVVRPVTLQSKTVEACKSEGHDERNMRLNRPQSPHLTIYAPQLTSMLSISHRGTGRYTIIYEKTEINIINFTGMVLGSYLIGLGLAGLACPDQIPAWIDALQSFPAPVLLGVKFCLSFPMAYHFWNGIRHLMWDMGKCLSLKGVYTTGYVMLAITFATSIALTML